MPTGSSVGRNYGPVVVRRAEASPSKSRRIAIPGKHTTAYLLLRLLCEEYQAVEMRFDQIPKAVMLGEVGYGLVIHEAQLTYASFGLEKIIDLGEEWMRVTGLPIPLGLDVVRKDLGKNLALSIWLAFKESILVANRQKDAAVEYALRYGRGLETKLGEKFVGMYVNDDTLELGNEGEKALNLLFDKSYRAGILKSPVVVDVLRP
jgi:1,4-dihydroxy-6-naphthoate synthase